MATRSQTDPLLFADLPAEQPPPAPDGTSQGPIASVAVLQHVHRAYSYVVPEDLAGLIKPGCRVRVPLGRGDRIATGYCTQIGRGAWRTGLKPIRELIDREPLLGPHMLELGAWISRYYGSSLGLTLDAMAPAGAKEPFVPPMVRCAALTGPVDPDLATRLPRAQRALVDLLRSAGGPMGVKKLLADAGCSAAPLKALAGKGLVRFEQMARPPDDSGLLSGDGVTPPPYALNEDQAAACGRLAAAIGSGAFRVILLYGVTGSGKTEVYIRAIEQTLAIGRQALLMVPEIGLTTQTVARLANRLGDLIALHSGLTDSQRARAWRLIASGRARVVIGTRSAVFAPCPDLGLIVIDEEQESSFKNMQSPRFHARDVAIKRAQMLGVPILLGSATPSLETWLNAHRLPHYELVRLPHRVRGLPLPAVAVVDMRAEHRERQGVHLLGRLMETKLGEALERKEQAVLLLNRRGFASYIFCPSCQRRVVCPRCRVNMVFHASARQAICHYCRSHFPVPTRCPAPGCGHVLVHFGMGTQRVEAELRAKFPQARVARVDSDVMTRAGDFARLLADFEAGRIDILIGTQMVAKGLDFPFVSFVGVVSADTALALPDFRAAERTFQLVTQVAGRAGRADRPGTAVVQTYAADLIAVRAALRHDYERFAQAELASRKKMGFPPYCRLTRILLEDKRPRRAAQAAAQLAEAIRALLVEMGLKDQADVIGPQPAPVERVRDRYRYDLLLRARGARFMQDLLDRVRAQRLLEARVQKVVLDVDPVSVL